LACAGAPRVPPVGHDHEPAIFFDDTLLGFETIWAAGGTPNSMFRPRPLDILRLTGGTVAAFAKQDRTG